jgi:hypothetical protein
MRRIARGASPWLVTGFYQLRFLIAATDRMPAFDEAPGNQGPPGGIA